uniref:Uncharacterized protein n=1 Tax=Phaeomonas parva TaxID=124430 RepID=A0A7S1XNY9_9STRA
MDVRLLLGKKFMHRFPLSALALERILRELRREHAEALLALDPLLRELVVRREPGGVGGLRRLAVRRDLLERVDALALGVEVEHEVHGALGSWEEPAAAIGNADGFRVRGGSRGGEE